MAAVLGLSAHTSASELLLWPPEDSFRLVRLLEARCLAATAVTCRPLSLQLQAAISGAARSVEGGSTAERTRVLLDAQQALADLDRALNAAEALQAPSVGFGPRGAEVQPPRWQSALENLQVLEDTLQTEMRYVYGPDWEMKPGKLVSKKGTWLKKSTRFSWELGGFEKLYLPQGVVVPVLQIGRVTDANELKRHDWASQHLRVWLKPPIVRMLESRLDVWYVYWPHFQDKGLTIVPNMDTWLKRSCQMSGELASFELIYLPRGLALRLSCAAEEVDEEWERHRHQHVGSHRRVTLAAPPLTMKQDHHDIYIGQGDEQR